MRLKIIRFIVFFLIVLIAGELFYFQAIRGEYYFNQSANNRIRVVPVEGWRGKITDREGVVMADDRTSFNVLVTPQEIDDFDGLFSYISGVLDTEKSRLVARYQRRRLTPFAPVVIAEDIPRERAIILEENKFRFPAMIIQESFKRFYPLEENSSHVLGFVGKITEERLEESSEYGYTPQSLVGYSGVEEYYDQYLRGTSGGLQIEVNNRGKQVRLVSLKEPTRGKDIQLTIDSHLQQKAQELLANQRGVIVVMDTDSGEILSMVSSPGFNPNRYYQDADQLFSNPNAPLINRAIRGVFPPGSVFKVPVAMCALDSQKINKHTTFDCPGFYQLGESRFGCTHVHGSQDLTDAMAHSCNVYFYHLGLILGADSVYRYAVALGLGQKTNIDLPYEKKGYVPNRRTKLLTGQGKWFAGDTLNFVIGQGANLVTPLQLVRMMAIVARNGLDVQPHLLKAIDEREVVSLFPKHPLRVRKQIFTDLQNALRATVNDPSGTAHILDIPGLSVSGKTGTAQAGPNKEDHAWFVGYVKDGVRNITFAVFLENGGSSHNACAVGQQLLINMKENNII